jgi:hypothetical protein
VALPKGSILSGGLSVAADATDLIGSVMPNALDKRNRERLARLERMAAADALGLTPSEREAILSAANDARGADRRASEAMTRQALAGMSAGSGEDLLRAAAAQEAEMRANQALSNEVASADLARKREQEDELEALYAARAERQMDKRQAASDFLRQQADTTGDFFGFLRTTGQFGQGEDATTGAAREAQTSALAQRFGVDATEASAMLDFVRQNPHLFEGA